MERFTDDVNLFTIFNTSVKMCPLGGLLGTCHQFQALLFF